MRGIVRYGARKSCIVFIYFSMPRKKKNTKTLGKLLHQIFVLLNLLKTNIIKSNLNKHISQKH